MSRNEQLQAVTDELRRLFKDGYDEEDACEQLKNDSNFSTVRQSKIRALYKQLKKEVGSKQPKPRVKPKIQAAEPEPIVDLPEIFAAPSINACPSGTVNLICTRHSNYSCASDQVGHFWNERFVIRRETNGHMFSRLLVTDLFSGETKPVRLGEQQENDIRIFSVGLYPSSDFQGYAWERCYNESTMRHFARLSLIELDLEAMMFRKIHTLNNVTLDSLFVDAEDVSRFVTLSYAGRDRVSATLGQLVGGEFHFELLGVSFESSWQKRFSYFDGKLYSLVYHTNVSPSLRKVKIEAYDLVNNTKQFYPLKPLPNGITVDRSNRNFVLEWMHDRLFVAVQFESNGHYGVARTDPESQDWKIFNFSTKLPIRHLQLVDGKDLMVQACDYPEKVKASKSHPVCWKVYTIPLKTPQSLRSLAWFLLVHSKKKYKDPYAEATKYLPLNSDLRSAFE